MSQSQNFEQYQWQNRLFLIYSENNSEQELSTQIENLLARKSELAERKLKVFQLTQENYREIYPEKGKWQKRNKAETFNIKNDFQVILIGLDGGVKLQQTEILEVEELFQKIDSMPMRQAEIRRKNN